MSAVVPSGPFEAPAGPFGAVAKQGVGELVFSRFIPAGATVFDCLCWACEEAGREAREAYEDWRVRGGLNAYVVYRAAQDRADAAQDALARCASELR